MYKDTYESKVITLHEKINSGEISFTKNGLPEAALRILLLGTSNFDFFSIIEGQNCNQPRDYGEMALCNFSSLSITEDLTDNEIIA